MQDAFPEGLGDVPTGAALCALLAPVDARVVPDERLLEVLSAQYRQLAYQQAQVWATMAEVTSRNPMANVSTRCCGVASKSSNRASTRCGRNCGSRAAPP